MLKTLDFDYDLPVEKIAQEPLPQRDSSKLLVWDSHTSSLNDSYVSQLPKVLRQLWPQWHGPIHLIVNNTEVYPARVPFIRPSGALGEAFFLDLHAPTHRLPCLLRPLKKIKVGDPLFSPHSPETPFARVVSLEPPLLALEGTVGLPEMLNTLGHIPLPPYIERSYQDKEKESLDRIRYQTVYAAHVGSCAAPTAGLHFSEKLISDCEKNQIHFLPLTLHVGLGTFKPVQSETPEDHEMHQEHFCVPKKTLELLKEQLDAGGPIVYVGTTSLRATESLFQAAHCSPHTPHTQWSWDTLFELSDVWQSTELFLYPKHKNDIIKPCIGHGLFTNFHQPQSTLCMLVAGLMGFHPWRSTYEHALKNNYRFLSYGDASLLLFPHVSV